MTIQRIPLVGNPSNRDEDTNQDAYFKNCYPEQLTGQEMYVVKRQGFSSADSVTAGEGRGIFEWNGSVWIVVGDTLYKDGVSVGTLNTSTGRVYFTAMGGGSPLLVLHDKTDMWYVNVSNTMTEVVDADFPTNLVSGIAFLDQYIFVMDASGSVWNSNVADVANWTATDFITAEGRPDAGISVTYYYNYIVAFGTDSIQMYYDAANASGSPLDPVQESIVDIGCAAGDTVISEQNKLIFVGKDRSGGRGVYSFEGLTPKKISNKAIDRLLQGETIITDAWAYTADLNGHLFYVLTLPTTNKTIVIDLTDNGFHEWTWYNGVSEQYFPAVGACTNGGNVYFIHETDGNVYVFDEDQFQDAGATIYVEGRTPRWDGDTNQNKFMNRLEVIGDENSLTSNLGISWSDDDYWNHSTARDVNLGDTRQLLTRLGRFQRRSFKYTFEANQPMRLKAFEVDVDLGDYGT